MRVLRGLQNAFGALWLIVALAVVRVAPVVVLFVLMGVDYRLAGTLVAIPAVVFVVFTLGAVRGLVGDQSHRLSQPGDDYLLAVAQAARAHQVPVPTVLHSHEGPGPHRPVAVRGWRWCFVYTSPGISPEDLIGQVRADLADGTARLRPLLWAVSVAGRDWAKALRGFATTVLPGATVSQRIYFAPLLVLVPVAMVGYLISWVVGLATTVLVTHRIRGAPDRSGSAATAGSAPTAATPATISAPDDRGAKPARLPALMQQDLPGDTADVRDFSALIAPMGRVIIALLVVFVGTYQGLGLMPAERTVWPWESEPEAVEVIDVQHVGADDGLLGHLGVRHNSTWRPTVALLDGSEARLAEGTTRVRTGELIPVVSWTQGDQVQHRHLHQTSWTRYLVMSVMMFGIAIALSRPFTAGEEMILVPVIQGRRLSQVDHDQRVLTGRRHRRKRPRHLPGTRWMLEDD